MEVGSDPDIVTRSGYKPSECFKAFKTSFAESGAISTGKTLHFAADLICSGGYEIFIKHIWNYSIEHIGIASLRIFVYLQKRVKELDELIHKLPEDTLYANEEFQKRICELILVIREQPQKSCIKWPTVGYDTHVKGWLESVKTNATETTVLRKVYNPSADLLPMYIVGCELLKACSDGALEKALFWIKWLQDEDSIFRKENHGTGLSTMDRGVVGGKEKGVGYYILYLFAESYKELASRKMIRMDEEYQALIDLYSILGAKERKNILGLITQILCEVPRWKVPAASTLIKDPATLSRTINQSNSFFKEVLTVKKSNNPIIKGKNIFKIIKEKIIKNKNKDKDKDKINALIGAEEQMDAYDIALNEYLNK